MRSGFRIAVACLALVLLAVYPLAAGHHHRAENDSSPCLICTGISSPALRSAVETVLVAPGIAEATLILLAEPCPSSLDPGVQAIRAPPLS